MNKTEYRSAFEQRPSEGSPQLSTGALICPYEKSLVGEFAKQLLLLITIPLLIWFARSGITLPDALPPLGAVILLVSLLTTRGPAILRIGLLALVAINLFSIVANTQEVIGHSDSEHLIPTCVLVGCLAVALIFETGSWLETCSDETRRLLFAAGLIAVPAIVYIFGLPIVELIWDAIFPDEKKLALRDPDWSIWREATYRTSEFSIVAFITFLGACIGSFLNVVAYCIPRGESIGFRDSKCLDCNSKIGRIDNIPIFSYINLGAKCRNCLAGIPPRYLIVELIVAAIFGSVFVFQLMTGCDNVPSMRISQKGILWVILYPKWPAIAIYFYHAFFMSSVLVLAVIEWDRQLLKRGFAAFLAVSFFLAAIVYWPIHPVSALEHLPISVDLAPWIEQALKPLAGGIVSAVFGFILAAILTAIYKFDETSIFRFALILAGVVLGWQAIVQISIVFVVTYGAFRFLPKLASSTHRLPTSVLLFAIMIHHPFWKTISEFWD